MRQRIYLLKDSIELTVAIQVTALVLLDGCPLLPIAPTIRSHALPITAALSGGHSCSFLGCLEVRAVLYTKFSAAHHQYFGVLLA